MELVSACALPVASLFWQPRRGAFCLTITCKATFVLEAPEARLASVQEPIRDADTYADDAPGSVRCPSDQAPSKARADIVLVGHAYAPGGEAVRSLLARLSVGDFEKTIEVVRDRAFFRDGQLLEGSSFVKMPLVYERAAGGPGTWNPVGRTIDAGSSQGMAMLPNLQPPGTQVATPRDSIEPVCFGPIAPAWPLRRSLFSRHAAPPADLRAFADQPAPSDMDVAYFNVAPPGQQVAELAEDAQITLENLNPERPHLSTRLPGLYPFMVVERPGRERTPIPMRCDTLWIDADRGICALTWRGQVPLAQADEPGRIVVDVGHYDKADSSALTSRAPSSLEAIENAAIDRAKDEESTMAGPLTVAAPPRKPTLPFMGNGPFVPSPRAEPPLPSPPDEAALSETMPPPHLTPSPPAAVAAPAMLRTGPLPPPLVHAPPAGLLDASNAAAGAAATIEREANGAARAVNDPAQQPRPQSNHGLEEGEVLQVLWYAPESLVRIRRRTIWREILDEVDEQPIDPELDDPELSATPADVEDRRAITAILRRGQPLAPDALDQALAEGAHDGAFTPKIALAAGELWLPFSDVALLEALAAAVTPLASEDEKLRAAARAASDFAATAWASSAPAVVEGLGARIKEILRQGRRAAPLAVIEAQVERAALEQRAYQKRMVLGGPHLRGLLARAVGQGQGMGAQAGVPVYLPERLSAELPMFSKFKVRLLAEVHPPLDQHETAPVALRAVALARVVALRKG